MSTYVVEAVEKVFLEYRKKHEAIIDFVSKTLNSSFAEYVFKRMLCEKLAEFYSANILFNKLHKKFENSFLKVYSSIDLRLYNSIWKLLSKSTQIYFTHSNIIFPALFYRTNLIGN